MSNNNNLWLGEDQRLLLEMYLGFYNTTQRQIDSLQITQQHIRRSIESITGLNNSATNIQSNMNNTNNTNNNRSYNTFPQTTHSANASLPDAFGYRSFQNTYSNTNNTNNNNNRRYNNSNSSSNTNSNSNSNSNSNNHPENRRRNRRPVQSNTSTTHNNIPYEHTNERIELNGRTYLVDLLRFNTNNTANTTTTATAPLDYLNVLQNFYSNVPVRPTQRQIDISTRIIRFGDIEDPINNSCPITLERFNNSNNVTQILECRHNFNSVNITS